MLNARRFFGVIGAGWNDSTLIGGADSGTQGERWSERSVKSPRLLICGLLLTLIPLQSALAIEGIITERSAACQYFVVKTGEGYAAMEWNGDGKPDRNDRLVGNYTVASMNVLDNATRGGKVKVWIEDYPLSYDDAMSIYRGECK